MDPPAGDGGALGEGSDGGSRAAGGSDLGTGSTAGSGGSGTGGDGEQGTGGSFTTGGTGDGGGTSTGGITSGTGGSEPLSANDFYDRWKVQLQPYTGGAYTDLEEQGDENGQSGFSHNADYTTFTFLLNEGYVSQSDTKSRVELRERDGDGEDVAWSQGGTHTLVSSVQILSYKIHDQERDIIILQAHTTEKEGSDPYDGGSSDSFGSAIYWRSESGKFECRVRPDSGDDAGADLLTGVSDTELQMFHTFRIQVQNGKSRCGYFNGVSWYDTPYEDLIGGKAYFKTGNYTQEANTSGSGSETRVVIQGLSVTHQ